LYIYIFRALGYYDVEGLSRQGRNILKEDEMRKQSTESDVTYRPDFSQMVPFKPKIQWNPGEHVAPGIL
jgi:cleavage stimulation factor subunit 3